MIFIVILLFALASIMVIIGIKKKLLRNIIIVAVITPVSLLLITLGTEAFRFSKEDAIDFLKADNLQIDDNFQIKSHHISEDLHGGFEEFTLALSDENKKKIIQQIKYSPYYLGSFVSWPTFQNGTGYDTLNQAIRDFQIDSTYVRQNTEKTAFKSTHEIISICGTELTMTIN